MMSYRDVDVEEDREILLELHCEGNYQSETPWARRISYQQYKEKWLSTSQPESFLGEMAKTMKDEKSIAQILEDEGEVVGYLWVRFSEIRDYDVTIAEIMDVAVTPDHRRRGIGMMLIGRVEELARERGADVIRSDSGIENVASQKLHEKAGFKPYRIVYEKALHHRTT